MLCLSDFELHVYSHWVPLMLLGTYDSQRQFLSQHSVAMLEQCCDYSKQSRNNAVLR